MNREEIAKWLYGKNDISEEQCLKNADIIIEWARSQNLVQVIPNGDPCEYYKFEGLATMGTSIVVCTETGLISTNESRSYDFHDMCQPVYLRKI